jgi:hypothetical protein
VTKIGEILFDNMTVVVGAAAEPQKEEVAA